MIPIKSNIEELINVISLNVVSITFIGFLQSIISNIPVLVSVIVGLSVVVLNILKAVEVYKRIKENNERDKEDNNSL